MSDIIYSPIRYNIIAKSLNDVESYNNQYKTDYMVLIPTGVYINVINKCIDHYINGGKINFHRYGKVGEIVYANMKEILDTKLFRVMME